MKKERKSRATGRPKGGSKPHGDAPLTEQVRLRLTAVQYERVVELATAAGVTPAEWARRTVERAITRARAWSVVAHLEAVGGMPSTTD